MALTDADVAKIWAYKGSGTFTAFQLLSNASSKADQLTSLATAVAAVKKNTDSIPGIVSKLGSLATGSALSALQTKLAGVLTPANTTDVTDAAMRGIVEDVLRQAGVIK